MTDRCPTDVKYEFHGMDMDIYKDFSQSEEYKMTECYNTACKYCVGYQCRRTCTCDLRLEAGEYVKVKHGSWIWEKPSDDCRCSNCGKIADQRYPYCPHCGAKMDEVEE